MNKNMMWIILIVVVLIGGGIFVVNRQAQKAEEAKMKADWDMWMAANKDSVLNSIALGKTKRVSASGVEDTKNDMMLSSYVQGESLEAVAELFKNHPHFGIPGATIEIMETRSM